MKNKSQGFNKIGVLSDLIEGGQGILFEIDAENFTSGFAINFKGNIYCYRNYCPHTGSQLDWIAGHFFDDEGRYLICSTHGAIFDPETGICINGPCVNQSLRAVPVKLDGNDVFACY